MNGAALFEVEKVARQAWGAAVRCGAQTGECWSWDKSYTSSSARGQMMCPSESGWRSGEDLGRVASQYWIVPAHHGSQDTAWERPHTREMVTWLFAVRDDRNLGCGLFFIAWCCLALFLGTQEWSLLAPAGGMTSEQSMDTSNVCLGEPGSFIGFPYRSVGKRLLTRAELTQRQPCHQSLSCIVTAHERWEPGTHCRQPHSLKNALSGWLRWSGRLPGSSASLCFSQKAQAQLHWEWLWAVLAA